jgi:hypothetical protein
MPEMSLAFRPITENRVAETPISPKMTGRAQRFLQLSGIRVGLGRMHHFLKAVLGVLLVAVAFFAGVVVVAVAAVIWAGFYLTRRFLHRPAADAAAAVEAERRRVVPGRAGDVIDVSAIEVPADSGVK